MIPGFSLTRQNAKLERELTEVILEVVRGGQFILGENVAKLEKEIADLCGVDYAIGVGNGSDALYPVSYTHLGRVFRFVLSKQ